MISHALPSAMPLTLVRGSDATGWHQVEVSGMGETGAYRIRVRVNNLCLCLKQQSRTTGILEGPTATCWTFPANDSTTRVLEPGHVSTESFSGGRLAAGTGTDEPDVDWFKSPELEGGSGVRHHSLVCRRVPLE